MPTVVPSVPLAAAYVPLGPAATIDVPLPLDVAVAFASTSASDYY